MSSVEPEPPGAEAAHEPATIVTFYSYKGGVGRTMALANVAWILAGEGYRVLVVDWDLESPGLHRFLRPFLNDPELADSTGVVDMVRDYGRDVEALDELELSEEEYERRLAELLEDHTDVRLHRDTLRWNHFKAPGSVEFLGPGLQNDEYSSNVALFNWAEFYGQYQGKRYVQALRERLRQGPYDYVLIDSRTGHSDNASVCTLWLPDVVVAGFNLSNQSVEGTAGVARQVYKQARETQRDIRILPVPMRVEAVDREKASLRRSYMERRFTGLVGPLTTGSLEEYWGQVEVRHDSSFSYEEVLVPFTLLPGTHSSQLAAYVRIAQEISRGKVSQSRPVKEPLRLQYEARFAEVRPSGQRTARIVHAARDRQWADWIRTVLAGIGISCETLGEWQAEPGNAAAKPTYTILVVSPALQSDPALDDVIQEHLKAVGRLRSGDRNASIVPVRVEEARVPVPIADLRGPHLQGLDEADARELLLDHFNQNGRQAEPRDRRGEHSSGGARFPGRIPRMWNSPPRNANFLGRETYIGQLRDGFLPGQSATPAILTGLLGVGKSQIALEFAYRFAADYDAIWWITADSAESVREQLADLGEQLKVTRSTAPGAVRETLGALAGGHGKYRRFLLVYDNVRRSSDLEGLLPGGGSTHVLITSETGDWSATGRQQEIDMPTGDEAREQLRRHFPGLPAEQAAEILAASGCLPQAVAQAAAYLVTTGLPLQEAVVLYRDTVSGRSTGHDAVARAEAVRASGYPTQAHNTWSVSMDSLREAYPLAENFLRLLVHMSPNGVSIDASTDVLRCPAALAWLSPPDGSPLTAASAGYAFHALSDRALARLDYGIKRVVGDPMGLAFLRAELSDEEYTESRASVQRILASLAPPDTEVDDPRHAPVFAELDQHVDPSGAVDSDHDEVRRWLVNQVRYRRLARRLEWAHDLAERLLEKWCARYGPVESTDDVLLLRLTVELGNVHRDAGRFTESEEINRKALQRLRATLGLDHPYTLRSATGRGAELRALGHVQEAFAEDQSTAEILAEVFGPDNPFTLMAMGNLALSLAMVGMTAEALDLHRETYERCRSVLGVEHRMTWSAASQLGNRYRESGDYTTSLRLLRQAFNEAEERFGQSDPTTLLASRGLAATLRRMGSGDPDRIRTARKCDSDAVQGWVAYAGLAHHEQLAAQLALAADLRLLEEHREACRLAEDALTRYGSWGESHPFRRISQVNLSLCRRSAGLVDDVAELSKEGWEGLCDTLGPDHPLTLIAALDHANALVFVGESAAALEMDRRTYELLRIRCGTEHPLTGFAATNLQDSEARVRDTGPAPGAERIEIDIDMPYI
ncbi:FxSxx-COOH system tetratricopeptide repeat protein [Streptomyces sp. NBC_00986]|uniref:FxSxx-COOH system tetratricopeptide repeat protein n=1 Tax=Streptomyces sp. NBC_00986 TaxID=2903702 RepID=UPI003866932A|nr:FxSxx-COOH system tetratricopeptide repeat protein [Streptomyces sp. NBC_00986]